MSERAEEHQLTLMPEPLVLIRIPKIDLDFCSKQLIRLVFFNNSCVSLPLSPKIPASRRLESVIDLTRPSELFHVSEPIFTPSNPFLCHG